jgi:hypothetical protein
VKDFFGRGEELNRISSFFDNGAERPRILVLHALGGQGKSQIALQYCQQSYKTYRGVFWINSSSKSTTAQAFVTIAQELDTSMAEALNDDDAKVKFALRTLEHWKDRWLMVFDNCDDPTSFLDIEQFIPQGILFTKIMSRSTNFLRRQWRYSLHKSPSRFGGARHYPRHPSYAERRRCCTSPASIFRYQCPRLYVRRL